MLALLRRLAERLGHKPREVVPMTTRERFVEWLRAQEKAGAIYIWDADGALATLPDGREVPAYDCSGLVCAGLLAVGGPDWRKSWWSQRMFDQLPVVGSGDLLPGDLCLYGRSPSRISHVAVYLGPGIIEAGGGDSTTTTVSKALLRGARVRRKSLPTYRNDLKGYRRLSLEAIGQVLS